MHSPQILRHAENHRDVQILDVMFATRTFIEQSTLQKVDLVFGKTEPQFWKHLSFCAVWNLSLNL